MSIAALITWLVTALVGFYQLAAWLKGGGVRQLQTKESHFPAPVIFGHFLLAATGLVVWIVYVVAGTAALAWTAFVILLPVALLGFTMLARWIPTYRAQAAGVPAGSAAPPAGASAMPAEQHIPAAAVVTHGLLAVSTLVLVLLTALGES